MIERKCPNCQKKFEFNPENKEIKCPHCKHEFSVEYDSLIKDKDKRLRHANLVMKVPKKVFIIPIIFIIILFFVLLFLTIRSYNKIIENKRNTPTIAKSIKSLSKINDNELKKLHEETLSEINNWNKTNDSVKLKEATPLGQYLLSNDSYSSIYDVYELTYTINETDYEIYTAVKYDVTYDDYFEYSLPQIHGSTLTIENQKLWGYNSIKDLYDNIDNTLNFNLTASSGLYKK